MYKQIRFMFIGVARTSCVAVSKLDLPFASVSATAEENTRKAMRRLGRIREGLYGPPSLDLSQGD